MTPSDLPLHVIKQAILSPEGPFSDGIGRFTCEDRFALTLDDWLILIADQSFHFLRSHSTIEWKVSQKSTTSDSELTLLEVFCGDVVVAHAAKIPPFQPLAKLLHHGGTPPESVQSDWRRQLAKNAKSLPNVCRILCRSDGILLVIPDINTNPLRPQLSSPATAKSRELETLTPQKIQGWKSISWPWLAPKPASTKTSLNSTTNQATSNPATLTASKQDSSTGGSTVKTNKQPLKSIGQIALDKPSQATGISIADNSRTGNLHKKNSKPKPKTNRNMVIACVCASVALLAAIVIWNSTTGSDSKPTQQALALAESKTISENQPLEIEQKSAIEEPPTEQLNVSDDADMKELASSHSIPSIDSLAANLDSFSKLEGELQNKVVLDELDTSNIIARSLKGENTVSTESNGESPSPSGELAIVSTPGQTMPNVLDSETTKELPPEQTGDNETLDQETVVDNNRRKDRLISASKKEKVNFGFSVVPKEAKWSVQLFVEDPVPESLTVTPDDISHTVGPGKVTWTLGLEDEEPELIVEVVAKPGRRWEIVWQVGFRESHDVPARLLGPKDATSVLSQLLSAKSFVGRMLTQNQVARDSGVRGPVDLFEQRRQLQRQDRELEQAIEKWKIIESLSRIVFQQTQIEFQATAPVATQ